MSTLIIGIPLILLLGVIAFKTAQVFRPKRRNAPSVTVGAAATNIPKGEDTLDPADYYEALERGAKRDAWRKEHASEVDRRVRRTRRERVEDFLSDPENNDALKRFAASSLAPPAPPPPSPLPPNTAQYPNG